MAGRVSEIGFAVLLRCFPPGYRARYGAEMLDAFRRERVARKRAGGGWSALGFVLAAYVDVVVAGWRERRREGARRRERKRDGSASSGIARRLGGGLLTGFGLDLKYAVRGLTRSWGFTLICLTSLAIGVGVNVAFVMFVWATFAPPPGVEEDGAVELLVATRGVPLDAAWSYPDFIDVRRADTGMDVTGWMVGARAMRTEGGADGVPVSVMYVSTNYFGTLGVTVPRGRAFLPEDDGRVGPPPVVVSHDMWEDRLGADPEVVGRSLDLNGARHRVIGVAPPRFRGHHAGQRIHVWIPLRRYPRLAAGGGLRDDRDADWLHVLGRLHEGVTMPRAGDALRAVMSGLAEAHPETNQFRSAGLVAYTKQGGGTDNVLVRAIFFGLSTMVLLIVCLNVAGMVLVRGATRERELALRMAVGSGRWRLVRYLMTESAVLAIAGGLSSLAAVWIALQVVAWRIGQAVPGDILGTTVGVCLGTSLAATLVIGLSPALRFSRPNLLRPLKDDAGAGRRRSGRIHRFATSVQTAVALPLLFINGMVFQATRVMDEADYGFRPDNLFVSTIDLAAEGYSEDEFGSFLRRLRTGVTAAPGVRSATVADGLPLDYVRRSRRVSPVGEEASYLHAETTRADVGFFETIGTEIVRGRAFDRDDVAGAEPVAVITESLAERLWPAGEALGKRLTFAFDRTDDAAFTVVGIAADVAGNSHESEPDNLFVPLRQRPASRVTLLVRAASEDRAIATAVQDAALRVDPDLTPPIVATSRSLMAGPRREVVWMSVFFGGLSMLTLFLAALGVYGVVAFAVANRTREIGVRMAMGASRPRVLAMVLADGAKLALPGIIVGSLLAVALARAILSRWYDYLDRTTLDWGVLTLAAGAALGVVLLASLVPARRASGLRPMAALKTD